MSLLDSFGRDRYAMLDALDAKSAAVLEISAIYLVLLYLEPFRAATRWPWCLDAATVLLIVAILPHFFVLWFARRPDERLVVARVYVFHAACLMAAVGVLLSLGSFLGYGLWGAAG